MQSGLAAMLGILGALSFGTSATATDEPASPPPLSINAAGDTISALVTTLGASEGLARLLVARTLAGELAKVGRGPDAATLLQDEIARAQSARVDGDSIAVAKTELAIRLLLLGRSSEGHAFA